MAPAQVKHRSSVADSRFQLFNLLFFFQFVAVQPYDTIVESRATERSFACEKSTKKNRNTTKQKEIKTIHRCRRSWCWYRWYTHCYSSSTANKQTDTQPKKMRGKTTRIRFVCCLLISSVCVSHSKLVSFSSQMIRYAFSSLIERDQHIKCLVNRP